MGYIKSLPVPKKSSQACVNNSLILIFLIRMSAFIHLLVSVGPERPDQPSTQESLQFNQPVKAARPTWAQQLVCWVHGYFGESFLAGDLPAQRHRPASPLAPCYQCETGTRWFFLICCFNVSPVCNMRLSSIPSSVGPFAAPSVDQDIMGWRGLMMQPVTECC